MIEILLKNDNILFCIYVLQYTGVIRKESCFVITLITAFCFVITLILGNQPYYICEKNHFSMFYRFNLTFAFH